MPNTDFESYSFEFLGGKDNSYAFQTNAGHTYFITFKPTPYLFELYPEFSKDTFEFSIIFIGNADESFIAQDVNTSITIAEIVNDFYSNYEGYITIYICDSSDDKQQIRKRKFNIWFNYFNGKEYIKIDESIKDDNGEEVPVSLIIKMNNPYRTKIFEAFTAIIEGYNHGK